jgi:hypothetical protein
MCKKRLTQKQVDKIFPPEQFTEFAALGVSPLDFPNEGDFQRFIAKLEKEGKLPAKTY